MTKIKTQHTMGTWKTDVKEGDLSGMEGVYSENENKVICWMKGNAIKVETDKRKTERRILSAEDVANARLIAASPNLLKAAKLVMHWASHNPERCEAVLSGSDCNCGFRELYDAITEAEAA